MAALAVFVLTLLNIGVALFTLREKWRAHRTSAASPDPAPDVLALQDIAAAIRELRNASWRQP